MLIKGAGFCPDCFCVCLCYSMACLRSRNIWTDAKRPIVSTACPAIGLVSRSGCRQWGRDAGRAVAGWAVLACFWEELACFEEEHYIRRVVHEEYTKIEYTTQSHDTRASSTQASATRASCVVVCTLYQCLHLRSPLLAEGQPCCQP